MGKVIKILREKNYKRIRKLQEKDNILDTTCIIRPYVSIRNSKVGYYAGINQRSIVAYTSIGNYSQLASEVRTAPRDHIYTNFMIGDWIYQKNEHAIEMDIKGFDKYWVKIGSDVWVGERAIILSRVEIGNGAIVAAGSVVTKSVPAYAVVGGVPAKFIKWRFDMETIKNLEEVKWYNWDIQKVIENKQYLENIVGFNMDLYKKKLLEKRTMIKIEG